MNSSWVVLPGVPYPLGATWDGRGVNFAVFSERAESLELCLFDAANPQVEMARLPLLENTQHVWHGYVPNLGPGTLYGFRAHGVFAPEQGLRFNSHKLLVDPYARAFCGKVDRKAPVEGYPNRTFDEPDMLMDVRDSAYGVPKSVVVDERFDWSSENRPEHLWRKSILYEVHVKGFTARHPDIPENIRGTYSGLAHPAAIAHLKHLGVTAVQLLPIHESVDEGFLLEKGLRNYWGYNSLGFFAPDQRFSSRGTLGGQVAEFKAMVKALHQAGIEVLLDVVFNHTAEGNHLGPTLSFRGLDNRAYYWLSEDARFYTDFTGCGNTLNVRHPQVVKLICDSLRYWVTQMHVDGFRFDLAAALGRVDEGAFSREAPLFQALHQDPVLSRVKLIAEPWDVGMNGYKLGNFPILWAEWNGRYKETVRRFWKGEDRGLADLGYRLSGSSDLFKMSGRRPTASINYVATHDGFTLHDAVTYEQKQNEANGENNQDGGNDNFTWNCGVEGETQDEAIVQLRERQKRNFLAMLMASLGTPMLMAGDELGRTQKGNNNAYCHDNELTWLDWNLTSTQKELMEFTRYLIQLRNQEPVLQRRNFFLGKNIEDSRFKDLVWFRADGKEMAHEDWIIPSRRTLAYLLGGDALTSRDPQGNRIVGDTLLVLINGYDSDVTFTLPPLEWGKSWEISVDTQQVVQKGGQVAAGASLVLSARSLMVLRHPSGE